MKDRARKWLIVGVVLGVLGVIVMLLGVVLLGLILVVAGVADLVIIALGYPSPRDISRVKRTLYKDEDRVDHDPDDALVSARIARDDAS
jgi:drug/metabolite transporter (DMT)-like permease